MTQASLNFALFFRAFMSFPKFLKMMSIVDKTSPRRTKRPRTEDLKEFLKPFKKRRKFQNATTEVKKKKMEIAYKPKMMGFVDILLFTSKFFRMYPEDPIYSLQCDIQWPLYPMVIHKYLFHFTENDGITYLIFNCDFTNPDIRKSKYKSMVKRVRISFGFKESQFTREEKLIWVVKDKIPMGKFKVHVLHTIENDLVVQLTSQKGCLLGYANSESREENFKEKFPDSKRHKLFARK